MKTTSTLLTLGAVASFALLSLNTSKTANIQQHVDIVENSGNPATPRTGAPLSGGGNELTCTACHGGGQALSATGVVDFEFDAGGGATQYTPGQTYPMKISVSSGNKTGFQMTIIDGNLQKAGDFVAGPNTATELVGGREYIEHSTSNGLTSFDFQWTAPATDAGDVRAFFTVNKANGNGSVSGDEIYFGEALIPTAVPASIGGFDENPNNISTFWDANAKQIHIDYQLDEPSTILVNVQSLNGQLIQATTIGDQSQGQYHQVLAADDVTPGVYIVAVFVNSRVFNYKMMLN